MLHLPASLHPHPTPCVGALLYWVKVILGGFPWWRRRRTHGMKPCFHTLLSRLTHSPHPPYLHRSHLQLKPNPPLLREHRCKRYYELSNLLSPGSRTPKCKAVMLLYIFNYVAHLFIMYRLFELQCNSSSSLGGLFEYPQLETDERLLAGARLR